jgi:hypothetical protein
VAEVSGSAKVAVGDHRERWARVGLPEKRSRMEETRRDWCGVREMEGAVLGAVFLRGMEEEEVVDMAAGVRCKW